MGVRRGRGNPVLGLPPNLVQAILCVAGFCCCIPMSVPQGHLVAFCGDLGITASTGAIMLSVLLGCAFLSRQFWGLFADRHGGLLTVLVGNVCQALAIVAFALTQSEAGLFAVSAAFGLGFSGIIPAYIVAIRDLFPSSEASWRVPLVLFTSLSGMAVGSWLAGTLYDRFGFYAPAFGVGVLFDLANLALIGILVIRQHLRGGYRPLREATVLGLNHGCPARPRCLASWCGPWCCCGSRARRFARPSWRCLRCCRASPPNSGCTPPTSAC